MTSRSRAMTPERTESQAQQNYIRWAWGSGARRWWFLRLTYHILNGAPLSSKRAGSRMVREGLLTGIPDLHVPCPFPPYAGLYIELKSKAGKYAKGKAQSVGQKSVAEDLRLLGYKVVVCWSSVEAILETMQYVVSGMSNQTRKSRAEDKKAALAALVELSGIDPKNKLAVVELVHLPDPDDSMLIGLQHRFSDFIDFVLSESYAEGTELRMAGSDYRLTFLEQEGRKNLCRGAGLMKME